MSYSELKRMDDISESPVRYQKKTCLRLWNNSNNLIKIFISSQIESDLIYEPFDWNTNSFQTFNYLFIGNDLIEFNAGVGYEYHFISVGPNETQNFTVFTLNSNLKLVFISKTCFWLNLWCLEVITVWLSVRKVYEFNGIWRPLKSQYIRSRRELNRKDFSIVFKS